MNNMEIYEYAQSVPDYAKKPISGGRLNGKTDIRPQWRTQVLTESAFSIIGNAVRGDYDNISLVYRIEDNTAVPYWKLLQGDGKSYIKGR